VRLPAGSNPKIPTMHIRSLFLRATLAALSVLPAAAFAEALVKPLPTPDLSKLPPDKAKELTEARADFENAKVDLVGGALATAYALMGGEYARAGFGDVAAVAFYDASQLAPQDARWLYLRGVIAAGQKQNAEARADYEAALALDKNYLPVRYRLADLLVEERNLDGAHKLLEEAVAEHGDQAALFAMLGRIEIKQQRYADAVANFQRALKAEPQANAIYTDLAAAFTALGKTAEAADAKAKQGDAEPSIADPLVAGLYQRGPAPVTGTPLEQARRLVAMTRFGEARAKIEEALKARPNDVDALALGARVDALTGDRDAAQQKAAQALKLDPQNAAANLSQGMVYEFAGDDANAYTYYQRALRADPRLADALLLAGNADMRRERYADAIEHYKTLAAMTPENLVVTARLVAAQVGAGRCGDALAYINGLLGKRAQDGDLMQIFVRLASTCPAAKEAERGMANDYARLLYKQHPDASDSAALALASAAQGKFDEAQKYQAEAIYEATRVNDTALADMYRATMREFAANKMPDRPWPANHPYFKPPLLTSLAGAGDRKAQ